MTYAAQNIAIESRFHTDWAAATPVKYDNVDFTPPVNSVFVEFHIIPADEYPASIGNAVLYRTLGIISINIYAPLNTGSKTLTEYCDTAAVIFRGQSFSSITCRGARITRLGEVEGRFVANVSIEFFRDEEF
jgi:hypothetical protein